MSLIRIRRERRAQAGGPFRPVRLWKLIVTLVLVFLMIHLLRRLA